MEGFFKIINLLSYTVCLGSSQELIHNTVVSVVEGKAGVFS